MATLLRSKNMEELMPMLDIPVIEDFDTPTFIVGTSFLFGAVSDALRSAENIIGFTLVAFFLSSFFLSSFFFFSDFFSSFFSSDFDSDFDSLLLSEEELPLLVSEEEEDEEDDDSPPPLA